MNKLVLSVQLTALLAVVVSCGASAAELKTARETRYKADPAMLYAGVKATTEGDYKIAGSDDAAFALQTEPRWYTPEGQADTTRGDNLARLQDKSINFSVKVRLVKADADSYTVTVEPVALRLEGLTSKAEPVDMNDPSVPGWVRGKIEALQLAIYQQLKKFAVNSATVPAMVPAGPPPATGSAAPEPAPAAPAPAP